MKCFSFLPPSPSPHFQVPFSSPSSPRFFLSSVRQSHPSSSCSLAAHSSSSMAMFSSMDSSVVSWPSGAALENLYFGDQVDFIDEIDEELAAVLGQDLEIPCLSPRDDAFCPSSFFAVDSELEPPAKLQKPDSYSRFSGPKNDRASSAPIILNFGPEKPTQGNSRPRSPDQPDPQHNVKKAGRSRLPSQSYDHIIAERKRREQLSQRFVALSTIVPGLTKTDKTSVLGDAIKYLKFLQERVKLLEEQASSKSIESAVLIEKSTRSTAEDGVGDTCSSESPLPEIEARCCNSQILIRIHCDNQKGVLTKIIDTVEKLNLTVVNTSAASFSRGLLDTTIVTQMEKEFSLTVKDVVTRIRECLRPRTPTSSTS